MAKLTKTIQVKRPLSAESKDNLLKDQVECKKEIERLDLELLDLKEREKDTKAKISEQQGNILSLIAQYATGFMPENVECEVRYTDNMTQFINVKTGEIENEYETPDKEQLLLNDNIVGTIVDAEDIIREDSGKG